MCLGAGGRRPVRRVLGRGKGGGGGGEGGQNIKPAMCGPTSVSDCSVAAAPSPGPAAELPAAHACDVQRGVVSLVRLQGLWRLVGRSGLRG